MPTQTKIPLTVTVNDAGVTVLLGAYKDALIAYFCKQGTDGQTYCHVDMLELGHLIVPSMNFRADTPAQLEHAVEMMLKYFQDTVDSKHQPTIKNNLLIEDANKVRQVMRSLAE